MNNAIIITFCLLLKSLAEPTCHASFLQTDTRVEERADEKEEHVQPSDDQVGVKRAIPESSLVLLGRELVNPVKSVIWTRTWKRSQTHGGQGIQLTDMQVNEWVIFVFAVGTFVYVQGSFSIGKMLSRSWKPFAMLLFWLIFSIVYAFWLLQTSKGQTNFTNFISGYLQELIFSMENILAFTSIMDTFQVPDRIAFHVLTAMVIVQVSLQVFLYLGLAQWLVTLVWLPFLLGFWLIYLGVSSVFQGSHTHHRSESTEPAMAVQILTYMWPRQIGRFHGNTFFIADRRGKFGMTLLMPLILTVFLTDWVMEVDVTLTKIETFPNLYVALSSSALAAFSVPSLYFVLQQMFRSFPLLHYGLCFVLLFFGVQLCCEQIFQISGLEGCAIVSSVLLLSGFCSYWMKQDEVTTVSTEGQLSPGSKTQDYDDNDEDNNLWWSCLSICVQLMPFRTNEEEALEDDEFQRSK